MKRWRKGPVLARLIRLMLTLSRGGGAVWTDAAEGTMESDRRRFMRDLAHIRAAGLIVHRTARWRDKLCRYWIDRDCLPWAMRAGRR